MRKFFLILSAAFVLATPVFAEDGEHAGEHHNKQVAWPFDGPMGKLDKPSAQRGFQIYNGVCAACHSMNLVAYRNLAEIGFTEPEIKALAAEKQVKDGPGDDGEMFDRAARPSDHFVAPYANEKAARASNGGAYPPDLSLIVKAREDGANYLYSLLTGYENAKFYRCAEAYPTGECKQFTEMTQQDFATERARVKKLVDARAEAKAAFDEKAKKDVTIAKPTADGTPAKPAVFPEPTPDEALAMKPTVLQCMQVIKSEKDELIDGKPTGQKLTTETCNELAYGKYYNPYYPGGQIAMPPPLADNTVTYMDDTQATLDQQARDITVFLQWAAEPEMERRKAMGIKVILFLVVMSGFLYVAKRRVWRDVRPVSKDDYIA